MNKIVLFEAADFDKDINSYYSWRKAKKILNDLKANDEKQYNQIKKAIKKTGDITSLNVSPELKKALTVILYNAALKNKIIKNPNGKEEKNIPQKAREIAKELGITITAGESNSEYKKFYSSLLSQNQTQNQAIQPISKNQTQQTNQQIQPKIAKPKVKKIETKNIVDNEEDEYPEDNNANEYKDYESYDDEELKSQPNQYTRSGYVGDSPKEIADKVNSLITAEIKQTDKQIKEIDLNKKLTPEQKALKKKLFLSKKNDLYNLSKIYVNSILKYEKGFSVYPTESSKIKSLTKAQIQYNKAIADLNKIKNIYISKDIGSRASLELKTIKNSLQNTYNKVDKSLNEPSEAKDIIKRATESAKNIAGKIRQNIQDRMQTMVNNAEQQTQATQQAQANQPTTAKTQPKAVKKPIKQPIIQQQTQPQYQAAQPQMQTQPQIQTQPQGPKAAWFKKQKS